VFFRSVRWGARQIAVYKLFVTVAVLALISSAFWVLPNEWRIYMAIPYVPKTLPCALAVEKWVGGIALTLPFFLAFLLVRHARMRLGATLSTFALASAKTEGNGLVSVHIGIPLKQIPATRLFIQALELTRVLGAWNSTRSIEFHSPMLDVSPHRAQRQIGAALGSDWSINIASKPMARTSSLLYRWLVAWRNSRPTTFVEGQVIATIITASRIQASAVGPQAPTAASSLPKRTSKLVGLLRSMCNGLASCFGR